MTESERLLTLGKEQWAVGREVLGHWGDWMTGAEGGT